jgi:hypothetical protein
MMPNVEVTPEGPRGEPRSHRLRAAHRLGAALLSHFDRGRLYRTGYGNSGDGAGSGGPGSCSTRDGRADHALAGRGLDRSRRLDPPR